MSVNPDDQKINNNKKMSSSCSNCFTKCCIRSHTKNFELVYPSVYRDESVIDDYFGVKVPDPYRWLEQPESEDTQEFIEMQNELTTRYINQCPNQEFIRKKLSDLYNYPKHSCPFKRGAFYFFFKSAGLQSQMVLYRQETLSSKPQIFLDLNISSNRGKYSIHSYAFSENGQIFSYLLSSYGSDWASIHFQDSNTGEKYPDVLEQVKYSNLSWTHDNRGLFYSRYPHSRTRASSDSTGTRTVRHEHQKLYYHRLGDPQSKDVIAAEFQEYPQWGIKANVSHCGNYLIIFPWESSGYNLLYFAHLTPHLKKKEEGGIDEKLKLAFKPLYTKFDSLFEFITNSGSVLFILTTKSAPKNRIVKIDVKDYNKVKDHTNWQTLIAEHERHPIDWALRIANDKIMVCYIEDVRHSLKIFSMKDGNMIKHFQLEEGSITCRAGKRWDLEFFYRIESILNPSTIYHIDLSNDNMETTVFRKTKHEYFDPSKFEVKQIFYASKDGTQIPMSIAHKKGLLLNGNNFCRLSAYGGFGISTLPTFFPPRIFLLEYLNGISAFCNVRGGGEYGENWHEGGCGLNQQKSFDDFMRLPFSFQAGAEYLIRERYTNPSKLAINGSSNGALLVAACVNQRPDLFGAAIPAVGVMDLLRFHKFTVGYCWLSEYGFSEDQTHFENLYRISPYHNVRVPKDPKVSYPSLLISTADHDDRVVPLHSLKFVAELQHKLGNLDRQKEHPILLRVYSKMGHGKGKSDGTLIKEHTDIYCFLIVALGLKLEK